MVGRSIALRQDGPGVFFAEGPTRLVSDADIAWLKEEALKTPMKRARICLHASPSDPVHEMIIALHHTSYVPPHGHPAKEESLQVIEGEARAVMFSPEGQIESITRLAAAGANGEAYFYRVAPKRYHGLRVDSDWLVFHEVAAGPFESGSNVFPDWSLQTDDNAEGLSWLDQVIENGRVE